MTKTIAKALLAQGQTGNEILEILDVLVAEYRSEHPEEVAEVAVDEVVEDAPVEYAYGSEFVDF